MKKFSKKIAQEIAQHQFNWTLGCIIGTDNPDYSLETNIDEFEQNFEETLEEIGINPTPKRIEEIKMSNRNPKSSDVSNPVISEVFDYHIFPPFIDAYIQSFWDEIKLPLSEIEIKMKSHALDWGKEAIEESILRGMEMPEYDNKIVLCCAYVYPEKESHNKNHYLVVVDEFCDNWYDRLQFIEGRVRDEWDVT